MKRKNKKSLIIILLLLISIGYAYLNSNLSINGTTGIANNTWDIHFENVAPSSSNTVTPTIAPIANPIDKVTELTYSVRFNRPGDIYEFNVDVVNAGTIDAMIETFTSKIKIGNEEEQEATPTTIPSYMNYYVTYSDGVKIKNNQLLNASSSETIKVYLEYKEDISESELEESAGKTILFNIGIKYTQATEEGIDKPVRLNCTYEGDLVNNATYTNGQYSYQYNSETDGWRASLTDKNSTDPVNTPLCSTINGKYINSMSSMFNQSKTTSIDTSTFDTSHVTDMSYMFTNCTNLRSVDVSDFDISNVTDMSDMFRFSAIERIDFAGNRSESIINLRFFAAQCSNLKYVNINNFGSNNLTRYTDMYYSSTNIEEIHMKNFNFGGVSSLGDSTGPFYNKPKLKNVDLSGAKMSNITSLNMAFQGDSLLNTLNLSNVYAPKKIVLSYSMFYDNLQLTNIDISSFDFSQTVSAGGMFDGVPATTVYVKDQASLDKLNELSGKPSTMTFVVK